MKEVFVASSRGNKYQVVIFEKAGKYNLHEYTNGISSGVSANYTFLEMIRKINRHFLDAEKNKIKYDVNKDLLDFLL